MRIAIPDLLGANCLFLAACGLVDPGDRPKFKLEKKEIYTKTGRGEGTVFIRLFSGDGSGRHVHVEMARKPLFIDQKVPRSPNKVTEIYGAFDSIAGLISKVSIDALFPISQDQLPEIIRATMISTEKQGVILKTAGGELEIENSPVNRIRWRLSNRTGVSIYVEARTTVPIDSQYLVRCLEVVQAGFDALILKR